MSTRLTWSSLFVWLACACSFGPGPDDYSEPMQQEPEAKMPAVVASAACAQAPSYEELSALNSCVTCHASTKVGSERKAAPESVNFDTEPAAKAGNVRRSSASSSFRRRTAMGFGRGALLWLLGVPLPIILLLALFWHH